MMKRREPRKPKGIKMDLNMILDFIVAYKWWLIACSPFLIAVIVIKLRG